MRPHHISIIDPGDVVVDPGDVDNGKPRHREFELSLREFFRAWREPSSGPYWSLTCWVIIGVDFPTSLTQFEIRKDAPGFDREFLAKLPHSKLGQEIRQNKESESLFFNWKSDDTSYDSVRLPYGSYHLVAQRPTGNCGREEHAVNVTEQTVVVKTGGTDKWIDKPVKFERKLCPWNDGRRTLERSVRWLIFALIVCLVAAASRTQGFLVELPVGAAQRKHEYYVAKFKCRNNCNQPNGLGGWGDQLMEDLISQPVFETT